ncbi:molybdopterin-dependent oxidoreductase [Hydrogenoanaerobacterium sp.]|uniref:molybdopterin-dependent oxidoreductase n=1 Tax=Hydrogenoanaerobacterium sp. TaxID=2953763 RepID=UPI00289C8923|nr:molybdopterin-dependent oxidoreductase [Hydrogenoanaerobacterium sp.]
MGGPNKRISTNFIIIATIAVLAAVVGVLAVLNMQRAEGKLQQASQKEIIVTASGQTAATITSQDLGSIKVQEFSAVQKSNGKSPIERTFKGAALIDVLEFKGVFVSDSAQVVLSSIDGYAVTLSAAEVADRDNIWLAWEMDGTALDENSGPYMVVVRKDAFSQRWAKQLCEIIVK